MFRAKNYLIGDYVQYLGDPSLHTEPLRSPDIGRIEEFRDFHGKESIYLYLVNKKRHIWCEFDKIRIIETSKKILESIGFIETENNNKKKYILNDLCISKCEISIPKMKCIIFSGFCAADFTIPNFNTNRFILKNEFDLKIFYTVYPYLNNVNDLLKYLKNNGLEVDSEKLFCS